jgi:dipeptidyl aminopeptidase/acylaminoacyl peptidase
MNPDGTGKKRISDFDGGITGFKYSPDHSMVCFTSEVKLREKDIEDLYEGLDKAKGKVINRMMYRHWDRWVETFSHLFIADFDGQMVTNETDIMPAEPWDVPMKPFWGMEQISWHPDGDRIAYASKKKDGMAYTLSTNSDIYIYDLQTKHTRNFTRGMLGYDLSPTWSPDGTKLAWESMKRDGYESDKNRIIVYDFIKNQRIDYSENFDIEAHGISWASDSESIYFTADWFGTKEIFRLDLNGRFTQITEGIHNYTSVAEAGDRLIATKQSMSMPTEIFSVPFEAGEDDTQITDVNTDILDQLKMGRVEKRWIETTDNKKMLTWVIYPPNFNPNKTYAALLYCQGGPQGMVSQFWSYRWNFQMMAANDYIIVAPNRRGVPGFGQEWKEQISGDYPGQNMKDLLRAIDVMAEEPWIDKELLGAVGASYGGYSVFWLAGHHDDRFSAFIAHDGMFNLESQYLETDEMWFVNWDLGGPYWEEDNEVAQRTYENSPHLFVDEWDTPILIIHGEQDYRIAVTQGMMAFNGAKLNDVQAQFLYFPDENHWVLSPQNGILWQRTFFKWLDKWLKPPPGVRRN